MKDSLIAMESEEELRSVPATMARLEQGLEVSTSDRDAAQAVADGLRDAKAANTRRARAEKPAEQKEPNLLGRLGHHKHGVR